MNGRTPCRISDGPQTPEDVVQPRERDEDQEYESWRQREIDDELNYEPSCGRCDGEGFILICPDDLCRGAGECMHGDGEIVCPACKGSG